MSKRASFGAFPKEGGTVFRIRAINAKWVSVVLFEDSEREMVQFPLDKIGEGIFEGFVPGIGHGTLYKFKLDEQALPDPFARRLPYGVHGPAMDYSSGFP